MIFKGKKEGKLKSVLTGAASALNLYGSTKSTGALFDRLERISGRVENGRAEDYNNISEDWKNVGSDMRSAFNKKQHLANCD